MNIKITNVTIENVEETGFFCYMSKRTSDGYKRKLEWLKARFDEGLRIKMLPLPARGFIEYVPGEFAWRGINAKGFMVIHCLWVVGQSKGRGFSKLLLDGCIADSKKSKMDGVAMVTSEGNWLAGKNILLNNGFESVDASPPTFELLVKKFRDVPSPGFVKNIEQRTKHYQSGLTVFRSDQCPYLEDATNTVETVAKELGINYRCVEMKSAKDVLTKSPSVYGVFSIVYDGKLLSHYYLLKKDLVERINLLNSK
ncbi:MAG: GNAT family N-acetyltransferase [Ignavibacteriae bacterium]|nr:GNAT family N-acetyltransferase [Ignavibacteriota bacterium]